MKTVQLRKSHFNLNNISAHFWARVQDASKLIVRRAFLLALIPSTCTSCRSKLRTCAALCVGLVKLSTFTKNQSKLFTNQSKTCNFVWSSTHPIRKLRLPSCNFSCFNCPQHDHHPVPCSAPLETHRLFAAVVRPLGGARPADLLPEARDALGPEALHGPLRRRARLALLRLCLARIGRVKHGLQNPPSRVDEPTDVKHIDRES